MNYFDLAGAGGGFVLGMAVGYALRKASKLILILGGILVVALIILQESQIITIHGSGLVEIAETIVAKAVEFGHWIINMLMDKVGAEEVLGTMAGFAAGSKIK